MSILLLAPVSFQLQHEIANTANDIGFYKVEERFFRELLESQGQILKHETLAGLNALAIEEDKNQ